MNSLKVKGRIVAGFARGSKLLGFPTANIEMTEENKLLTKDLIPGIYSGFSRFENP